MGVSEDPVQYCLYGQLFNPRSYADSRLQRYLSLSWNMHGMGATIAYTHKPIADQLAVEVY